MKGRIAIIDDEVHVCRYLGRTFSREGYEIETFEEEVIRFVTEQGITHLIVESFEEVTKDEMKYLKSIDSIRHRVKCRVEVVQ